MIGDLCDLLGEMETDVFKRKHFRGSTNRKVADTERYVRSAVLVPSVENNQALRRQYTFNICVGEVTNR